ncbi:hypothetical protein [Acinetobacter proteolyticus]|uniref:Uncharacterized protein n=1 Tax=Acinetobacter proteolyticus TaxID=1776741 RepID=A0A2N0WIG4_9GAMM|nr:hypothetical protein [Acinetobacter proteolyticus]MBK5646836.1 hypothetical protein [Acinetobacter sp.]PKF35556.1 hypothetical protein CW311_04505 [Acinetobacter proteolyticus]
MQIFYDDEGEKQLVDGEFLKCVVIRNDLVPVPVTLEAEIRVDDDVIPFFREGEKIYTNNDDEFTILKSEPISAGIVQGQTIPKFVKIIAVLSSLINACYVKEKSIKKKNTTLADIYRAIGCKADSIQGDFTVPTFNCLAGEPPSYQIASILQESAGVMRWRDGQLAFMRLEDLFKQEVITDIPIAGGETVQSGFLERHEIPTFFSIDDSGNFIYGNKEKARTARFVANKDLLTLKNMSTCLVLKQISRIAYNDNIVGGEHIQVSAEESLIVITAVHVFAAGVDGDPPRQYTKLWLGELHK